MDCCKVAKAANSGAYNKAGPLSTTHLNKCLPVVLTYIRQTSTSSLLFDTVTSLSSPNIPDFCCDLFALSLGSVIMKM